MAAVAKSLTPHSEWCQDMDRILLKIKIPDVDVKDTKMDITKDKFSFSYKGGGKEYHFEFMFRFPVNASTVKYRSTQRDLALVIEKETSNSYWPHLMPKTDKKKYKNHCLVDWDRFMDEDDAKKSKKGIVDDEDGYGNLAGMGMGAEESSSDDSDDEPIDDLEMKPTTDVVDNAVVEEAVDVVKPDDKEENKESTEENAKGDAEAAEEVDAAVDVD